MYGRKKDRKRDREREKRHRERERERKKRVGQKKLASLRLIDLFLHESMRIG